MVPFVKWEAIAAPIDERNLDTNQLCPTRFNKLPVSDPDYHRILFHNQRFHPDGTLNEAFLLNREPYTEAGVLVADENFGCGSSRESAVYALLSFGVRAVVAPSFGDIFYSNCTKNGLLPVVLPRDTCDALRAALHAEPGARIAVDLPAQTLTGPGGTVHAFEVHPAIKHALLEGLDDVGLTLSRAHEIAAFETRHHATMPWIFG